VDPVNDALLGKKKFSILVPHKNSYFEFERLINSIPDHVEIIAVDDNSDPDIFNQVCSLVRLRSNVKLLKNPSLVHNAGVARNVALEYCNSEWVIFADSDDEFCSENLNEFISKFGFESCDVVYFGVDSFDELTKKPTIKCKLYKEMISSFPLGKEKLSFQWQVPWGRAIRKEFLEDRYIMFESRVASNDVEFSAKLAIAYPRIAVFKKMLYRHYQSTHSLSGTLTPEKAIDRLEASINRNEMFFKARAPVRLNYNFRYLIVSFPVIFKLKRFLIFYQFFRSFLQAMLVNIKVKISRFFN
jgi:glycosyltransferase involved in cell wall biosynthesis